MSTTTVAEKNFSEKARDVVAHTLWTGVTRHIAPLPQPMPVELTLDEQYVAVTFARVVEKYVDDVLEGIDEASTDTTHAIARCADGNGTLTHLFFSDDEFDIARAKAICSKCRLAPTCLEGALERAEPYGVWGGELLIDGVIVAIKRGRGRPPKTPRPVLVVDEVPVPPHLVA